MVNTATDPGRPDGPAPSDRGGDADDRGAAPALPGRPLDGVAVAAVALGIAAMVPFAALAGSVALARTRDGRRRGRRLAVAGLALAAAWTLAGAGAAAVLLSPRPTAPRRPHPLRDTVFSLRVGQCADTASNGVAAARVLSCAHPHEMEIYGAFHVAGRVWPGEATLAGQARQGCASRLAGYLNPQLAATNLAQAYVYPDQGAWSLGERTVICEIRSDSGALTGSVRALGG